MVAHSMLVSFKQENIEKLSVSVKNISSYSHLTYNISCKLIGKIGLTNLKSVKKYYRITRLIGMMLNCPLKLHM